MRTGVVEDIKIAIISMLKLHDANVYQCFTVRLNRLSI